MAVLAGLLPAQQLQQVWEELFGLRSTALAAWCLELLYAVGGSGFVSIRSSGLVSRSGFR